MNKEAPPSGEEEKPSEEEKRVTTTQVEPKPTTPPPQERGEEKAAPPVEEKVSEAYPIEKEERILRGLLGVAEGLETSGIILTNTAVNLKALLAEITEVGSVSHITDKDGRLLARVVRRASDIVFLPRENLGIKADHGAIQNFLVAKVLEGMKKKYGLNYTVESIQGLLKAIRVEGPITDEVEKDLAGPVQWTLIHALVPPSEQPPKEVNVIEDVKAKFPSDLKELLTFEQEGDYVIIKPRQYLGSENFAKIASIVREAAGEYISAGKESHFRIKKER